MAYQIKRDNFSRSGFMPLMLLACVAVLFAPVSLQAQEPVPDRPRLERLDRNDDGRIGPRERQLGKQIRTRLDRNGDGRLGPREWRLGKKMHNRMDRNGDGRVGPKERRLAKKLRAGRATE